MPPLGLALGEVVEADADHSGDDLEQAHLAAVAFLAQVGGDRLGALGGRPPRRSNWTRSDGGKHSSASRPGSSLANGSPSTIAARIRSSRWSRLKQAISSSIQCDLAAAGEQSTIRKREPAIASSISSPRSVAAASSCRSRKIGRQPLGHRALLGQLADQPRRNAKLLQLFVQPVGDRRILVAVAEEGHVAQLRRMAPRAGRRPANGSRQLGKLGHRPPQLDSR